jgi:3-oxoacyl-[acyl-carrier protein] reductase
VTGGAKGIGRSIATALARDGWNLIVCGRDEEALSRFATEVERPRGTTIRCIPIDLSQGGAAPRLLQASIEAGSLPDAIVCNAGNYGALGSFADVDFVKWKRSFDLNFFAAAELVHEYLKVALAVPSSARRKIVIVGGSGIGGARVWPGISAYGCAKSALVRLVEFVHEEVYTKGIDINCLAPGAVSTGITDQAVAAGATAIGDLHRVSLQVRDGGGDPPALVEAAVAVLLRPACDGLSGRLISAKWDSERLAHPSEVIDDADLLRLRRIDADLFGRLPSNR